MPSLETIFYNIGSYIISLIISIILAVYRKQHSRKFIIRDKQLQQVYLPLYKLLCINKITATEYKAYSDKISAILYENYELVFPQLHTLSKQFSTAVSNNSSDCEDVLKKIIHQVRYDYCNLIYYLGYPTQNAVQRFFRMTDADKAHVLFKGFIIFCTTIVVYYYSCKLTYIGENTLTSIIIRITAIFTIILLLGVLFYFLRHFGNRKKS